MSWSIASFVFGSALAGPAQDIAAEFRPDRPAPAFGLACSPVREALRFADALGSFSGGTDRPELDLLLEAARDASVETVDGLDVDGGFVMVAGPGGATVVLPMRGDIHQAIELFVRDSDDPADWTVSGATARATDDDGTVRTLAVDGAAARLTVSPVGPQAGPSRARGAGPPAGLLDLPTGSGCALWVMPPPGKRATPALLRNPVALWVPFEDGAPMQLSLELPSHRDRDVEPEIRSPLAVASPSKPQAVVTLGVPPLAILRDPVVLDSIPAGLRTQLPEPGLADTVGAGLVVGTFLGPAGPSLVAVVPFETERGRPVSARRIWKVTAGAVDEVQASRGGSPPVRVGRRALQVQLTPRQVLTLQAEKGRLIAGNVRSQVEAVARGDGEPWLDDAEVAWAETHAFSLFGEVPLPGLGLPLGVTVGAGTRGDVLQLQVDLDPGLRDPRVAAALRALSSARQRGALEGLPMAVPVPPAE